MKFWPFISVSLFAMHWSVYGESINVAVASNFNAPMQSLVEAFENQTGHEVRVSYGSSGKFFAQITHGAPYHVFLSADQAKPLALEKTGLVVPNSRITYAVGVLVVWSWNDEVMDADGSQLRGGDFRRLALANPKFAPYGMAAVQVMENLGIKNKTVDRWVMGENVAQTFQFVKTRNADLGFVALSQVMVDGAILEGSGWVVPSHLHTPIRQDAVLLTHGENSQASKAFLAYLQSGEAQSLIRTFGYTENSGGTP